MEEEAFNFYKSVFGGELSMIVRFKDMPHHVKSLTQPRKRNGTSKSTHHIPPDNIFNNVQEAVEEYGKRSLEALQILFPSKKEGKQAIDDDSRLISGQKAAGGGDDHFRDLIAGPPHLEFHKRETIFVTPDGKYIDNRVCQNKLFSTKKEYVYTFDSEGKVLCWEKEELSKSKVTYNLVKFDKAA